MRIDPFAPVKIESFDLTTDDTPTPNCIENGTKTLLSYQNFEISAKGKILHHSIIADSGI